PFYHRNMDYDEVLFYHRGSFFSRAGIKSGMLTLHPQGIQHGPQPQAVEESKNKGQTDEVAVMVESQRSFTVLPVLEPVELKDYALSWSSHEAGQLSGTDAGRKLRQGGHAARPQHHRSQHGLPAAAGRSARGPARTPGRRHGPGHDARTAGRGAVGHGQGASGVRARGLARRGRAWPRGRNDRLSSWAGPSSGPTPELDVSSLLHRLRGLYLGHTLEAWPFHSACILNDARLF